MSDDSITAVVTLRLPIAVVKKIKRIAEITQTTPDQVIAILLILADQDAVKKTLVAGKKTKKAVKPSPPEQTGHPQE